MNIAIELYNSIICFLSTIQTFFKWKQKRTYNQQPCNPSRHVWHPWRPPDANFRGIYVLLKRQAALIRTLKLGKENREKLENFVFEFDKWRYKKGNFEVSWLFCFRTLELADGWVSFCSWRNKALEMNEGWMMRICVSKCVIPSNLHKTTKFIQIPPYITHHFEHVTFPFLLLSQHRSGLFSLEAELKSISLAPQPEVTFRRINIFHASSKSGAI